ATTSKLGSVTLADATGQYYELDLTSYVAAQKAGGSALLAFLLQNPATSLAYSLFASREASNKPQLVVTSDDGGPAVPNISVAASDPNAAEAGSDPGTFTLTRGGADNSAALAVAYAV